MLSFFATDAQILKRITRIFFRCAWFFLTQIAQIITNSKRELCYAFLPLMHGFNVNYTDIFRYAWFFLAQIALIITNSERELGLVFCHGCTDLMRITLIFFAALGFFLTQIAPIITN